MLARHLLRRQIATRTRRWSPISPGSLILPRVFATSSESSSPPPRPKFLRRTLVAAKWSAVFIGSTAVGVVLIGGCIFIHDAFTYNDKHLAGVPVSPLALQTERGGPKNLPIASRFLRDDEDEEMVKLSEKPRLVIVGGGWGAVSLLKTLQKGQYQVFVVATETFNTFTPLLPSAAVGTVQFRTLMEPLRKIIARVRGHFILGKAVDVHMSERLLEVQIPTADGKSKNIYVPYDKLVIACGSTSSTHGVPGLENCLQLKTIGDAQGIRRRLLDNFETASLPTTSAEERSRLLSFVVCGGGPTGVETAAEIYDLCQEDIIKYFPKLVREKVNIHVIQSMSHILNTYSEGISKYAEDKFKRDGVNLITNARVNTVHPDKVIYTFKDPETRESVDHEIATNFVLWSTGIAMNPFTQRVSELLPNQVHRKAIEVDSHLRVNGAPLGTVYAIGDCATIETHIVNHLLELVETSDKNHDGRIDYPEWEAMVEHIKKVFPSAKEHIAQARELFVQYDFDKDSVLGLNELAELLQHIGNKITSLPPTAQVASQEGKYLGRKLSKLGKQEPILKQNGISATDEAVSAPFEYKHLGSLAYIGNAAVFDLGQNYSFMGGLLAMYAWRSVYWSEQVSARTRALLMIDWIIRGIWGRDLSRL
ncbi:nucleotide-binding domain-containing protein [Gautieria morchelliformis]|nr:nucleotide-binding domain-containing protein [Gautieria morchelliformis]